MPDPLQFASLAPWSPARHPLGDCRVCGLPALTVDESRTVCHPTCYGPYDAPAVALAEPLTFEETG